MNAVDPIILEILQNKLLTNVCQITHRLVRARRSFMIKEMEDCSASLFDAKCLLAKSANIPIHLNCVGICLRSILDHHLPSEEWRPGDVVLTNDPYLGGGSLGSAHANDLVMYAPVFVDNDLVGFAGVMAHRLDIGATTMATRGWNTGIQQERLLIPPIKLVDEGRINSAVLQMVLRNTRVPEALENDMLAQLSSLVAGGNELAGIFTAYGTETLSVAVEQLIHHAETRSRQEIAAIPDGIYRGEVPILDDGYAGGPHWLRLAIRKSCEESEFDFTGTDPQIRGPVNAPFSTTMSAIHYVMRRLTDPSLPNSEGCKLPIRVIAPEGTLVNARQPAAVYQRMVTCHSLVDLVMRALAEAVPERVNADSCGCQYNYTSGFDREARGWFSFGEVTPGGIGATSDLDGIDAMACHVTNCALPPIEATEIESPALFLRREYQQDSGGAGYRRGGMGQVVAYKIFSPEAEFTHTPQKSRVAPRGFAGGMAGACGRWVINEGMPDERTLEYAMGHAECLRHGTTVTFSGGGFGDPRQRERKKVEADLLDGLSGSVARDVYGCAELCPEREVG